MTRYLYIGVKCFVLFCFLFFCFFFWRIWCKMFFWLVNNNENRSDTNKSIRSMLNFIKGQQILHHHIRTWTWDLTLDAALCASLNTTRPHHLVYLIKLDQQIGIIYNQIIIFLHEVWANPLGATVLGPKLHKSNLIRSALKCFLKSKCWAAP